MRRLMILGGSRYAIPVIEAAHRLGLYVITCDYLPDNIAHKYSDHYCNVSIIDKDAALKAAQEQHIDGIVSFACDPGVVTAAYIAEKMGLPFQCSYESARILQDKGLFRQFLTDNGFPVPHARRYTDVQAPFDDIDYFHWPVMVKPTDSAGSKGVTKVDRPEGLADAIKTAVSGSLSDAFIIEDYIAIKGYRSSTDPFTIDGQLVFAPYSDQLFDEEADNPYVPTHLVYPSTMEQADQDRLTADLQRLMNLLHVRTGIYNVETCIGADGTPYIMEVSPRGGGCQIAELQRYIYGVDMIENEVRKAVGMPLTDLHPKRPGGCWCRMVVHARHSQTGILKSIEIAQDVQERYLKMTDLVAPGSEVHPLTGANTSLGDIFVRCDTRGELDNLIAHTDDWLQIRLES